MTGFNKNLSEEEKIHCLICLSSEKPTEKEDGSIVCSECGSLLQQAPLAEPTTVEISPITLI
jgi:transcription initiation factor TFIIIB Brf1 subunit/transcription initiation factor TFIIB